MWKPFTGNIRILDKGSNRAIEEHAKKKLDKIYCAEDIFKVIQRVEPVTRTVEVRNTHRHLIGKS